ncbi:MAG TPA: translocation/assembly module TamB [Chlorobaculum parvum]|uniref:Translocation/assembly module TamB n=1 Tax=Chlorobaculum parvum TaxID=274539 RepID=A0A7C5HEU3_9CHLB|nr:translocation/assembly module TamB [Chlorobaculum parvum]
MEKVKKYSHIVMTVASITVIVLVIAAAIVLNSGMTDLFVKQQFLSLFNNEYRGRLELKEAKVRFPDKITLVGPAIYEEEAKTPVAGAETINIRFNFLSLLRPKITMLSFRNVEVKGARIDIVEHDDGELNLQKVFLREHPETPEVLAIEKFRARHFTMESGSFSWKEKTGRTWKAEDLNLNVSKAFVAKYEIMGKIKELHFDMPDRNLKLRSGTGMLAFTSVRSDVIGLDLQTDRSRAQLSVSMDGLNIFSGLSKERLMNNRTFAHIEALDIDSSELGRFVDLPAIPSGMYHLQGDTKGTLSDLKILPTSIEHGDSNLALEGEVLNLLDPKVLSFNLNIDQSRIEPELLDGLLKEERYRKLAAESGGIDFSGMLRGRLDRWMTKLDFSTALGSGSADFETSRTTSGNYQATGSFTLEGAQLHRFSGIDDVESGFSGEGDFTASPGAINAEVSVNSAFWQQQTVSSGSLKLDFNDNKLDLSTKLYGEKGEELVMSGNLDLSKQVPSYEASGTVKKLDLSKASGMKELTTDLNGSFKVKGSGLDAAALNLKASILFEPSYFNSYRFREKSAVTASIVQSAGSSSVAISSNAFDLAVKGSASLDQIINAAQNAAACIAKEFGAVQPAPPQAGNAPFAFNYRVAVRDLSPLRPFLQAGELQFTGNASGKASGNDGQLSIDAAIDCPSLSNGNAFSMSNAAMNASMSCQAGRVSSAKLTGSVKALSIIERKISNLNLISSLDNDRIDASLKCAMPQFNETLTASAHGLHRDKLTTVTIDSFQLTNPQGTWQARAGGTIDIASNFLRFNRVRFSKAAQVMELNGLLSSSQPGTFRCTLTQVDLAETKFVLLDRAFEPLKGLADIRLTVSGAPGDKTSTLELQGSGITWDELNIGTVKMNATHSGNSLRFELESHGSSTPAGGTTASIPVNTIKGSGSIPLVLNYSPFVLRIPENRPIRVSLRSDDLSAKVIAALAPAVIDQAEGTIPTDLRIAGSMPKPEIFLTTTLNNTSLRVAATRVTYRVNGRIVGTPSRIDFGNLKVRDEQGGIGTVTGMIGIEGLKPVSVNLYGTLDKLLFYNKPDLKDDTNFGTITGSTRNIRFYGDLNAPTAEGELRFNSVDFSIYRKGSGESAKYIGVEKFITFVPRHPLPKQIEAAKETQEEAPEFYYTLLDILQIKNLKLSANVPLKGTMIFDRIRGERIESTLNNLSLVVNKSGQRFSLFGSVDITGGKYTFSNSGFDLENVGRISWNNEEIRDGRLIDIYGSKQVSAYDPRTGERDNVKLLIAVSGTIEKPNVRMGYYLNDDPQPYSAVNKIGRQASHIDPNADLNVITMLFTRQWYLNPQRQGVVNGNTPVSSVGVSAGTGLISSQISGLVQDLAGLESFNVNLGTGADGTLSDLELYFSLLVPGTGGKVRFIGTGTTPVSRSNTTTPNYYYGSSQKIEYRVNPKVYVEAFRSYGMTGNDAAYINLLKPTENWGVSVSYRKKFHTWSQFWDGLFGDKKKRDKQEAVKDKPE